MTIRLISFEIILPTNRQPGYNQNIRKFLQITEMNSLSIGCIMLPFGIFGLILLDYNPAQANL